MNTSRILIGLCIVLLLTPHLLQCGQPGFMDERPIVANVCKFVADRTLIPYHFKYPTLYSYLVSPVICMNGLYLWKVGRIASPSEISLFDDLHPREVRWPARAVSVCMLALAAFTIGSFAWRKYGLLVGGVAGSYLLATPWLLPYSGYALPDITAMFFVALALLQSLRFLAIDQPAKIRLHAVGTGVLAGLAATTKYNAGVAIVPALVAAVFLAHKLRLPTMRTFGLVATICLAATLAFVIGSPAWVLVPGQFMEGLQYEAQHAKIGHLGAFGLPILGQFELLLRNAPSLTIVAMLGLVIFVARYRRRYDGWVVVSLAIATLLIATQSLKQSPQYLFPMAPACAMFAALFFHWLKSRWCLKHLTALAAVILCFPLVVSWHIGLRNLRPEATTAARQWIESNIPSGQIIAFDWAYVPRFFSSRDIQRLMQTRTFQAAPHLVQQLRSKMPTYRTRSIQYTTKWLTSTDARYIVTSSACYERYFNYGVFTRLPPPPNSPLYEEFQRRKTFYTVLFSTPAWKLLQHIDTGNGPRILIFGRSSAISEQGD